jgi:hypothetical protein
MFLTSPYIDQAISLIEGVLSDVTTASSYPAAGDIVPSVPALANTAYSVPLVL